MLFQNDSNVRIKLDAYHLQRAYIQRAYKEVGCNVSCGEDLGGISTPDTKATIVASPMSLRHSKSQGLTQPSPPNFKLDSPNDHKINLEHKFSFRLSHFSDFSYKHNSLSRYVILWQRAIHLATKKMLFVRSNTWTLWMSYNHENHMHRMYLLLSRHSCVHAPSLQRQGISRIVQVEKCICIIPYHNEGPAIL